ncbi:unnamed protein product [Ceratitis capitata]|uniref:(Mediterranean fruit fly) hypothetical protein n=1 Tax=Ceratitis capitata TaxID=7213 RepID=A0A811U9H7_CERCA|nr:unnamed protein product [Ceratitis capitata]
MASHLDPQLEDRILHEVKSQGVFDEFRKDSMADVDTKPAYQNLRQRVENTVKKFLSEQQWTPDMNKNQLREKLRRHITESGFLDVGVERIVDQVVNPKIGTIFQPRIEEITYKYLGLPPPPVKHEPPPPPMMHPLPPLPLSATPLKIETSSLLPTGLEQISPDSDKATVKSECREDDRSILDMDLDTDEKVGDEDDESPPFEPLVKCVDDSVPIKTEKVEGAEEKVVEKPVVIKLENFEIANPHKMKAANQQEIRDSETQDTSVSANSIEKILEKNANMSFGAAALVSQDSNLSQVSSDSNISDVTANASHSFTHNTNSSTPKAPATMSEQMEAAIELASANISEEAQMPKFSENSSETTGAKSTPSELHFDIKKDEIIFEGTERKSNMLEQEAECNTVTEDDVPANQANGFSVEMHNKEQPHHFSNHLEIKEQQHHFGKLTIETKVEEIDAMGPCTPAPTPTPTPHDSSFGSSLEDSSYQQFKEDEKTEEGELKTESVAETNATFSAPLLEQGDKKETITSKNHGSSTSSSKHKKHSKDKKRSHDSKDKHKDRHRSKHRDRSRDKDKNSDKDRDKSKHRDKERHRDKDSSRKYKDKNRDKDKERDRSHKEHKSSKSKSENSTERSSSSKRSSSSTGRSHDTSSSKIEKHANSKHPSSFTTSSSSSSRSESHDAKREKRDSERKHHRSSSKNESSAKRDEEKVDVVKTEPSTDDHGLEKAKVRRRKSTDSNDEDPGVGNGSGLNGSSERAKGSLSSIGIRSDKQTSEQKEPKNSTDSPKGKTKSAIEEYGYHENHPQELIVTNNASGTTELSTQIHHRSKVVILNDMLENPNINFIDLGPTATAYTLHTQDKSLKDNKVETTTNAQHPEQSANVDSKELLYFEGVSAQFSNRLRLLDNAMDRCRRVVNNLRFDCANELCDTFETGGEQQNANETNKRPQACATLTIDCVPTFTAVGGVNRENSPTGVYDLHGSRKRNNNGNLIQSKPSPTPSDASVNSKENMALDKNADEVKCVVRRIASVNKMSQQRYTSEDLYKPRPVLSQRSRRRGMDTVI